MIPISDIQGYSALNRIAMERMTAAQPQVKQADANHDTISLNPAMNMTDEEAEQLLQETTQEITATASEVLSVHQGLDYNRVMALLGDLNL